MSVPVVTSLLAPPTPDRAIRSLAQLPRMVLFESALTSSDVGRYSFLSADPILSGDWRISDRNSEPLEQLRRILAPFSQPPLAELPPFQGGLAGVMTYECGAAFERMPRSLIDEFAIPQLSWGLYDWVLCWDHLLQKAWIVSHGWRGANNVEKNSLATERIRQIETLLSSEPECLPSSKDLPQELTCPRFEIPALSFEQRTVRSNVSFDQYLGSVRRVMEYIRAGDIFQANFCQTLIVQQQESPIELYCKLRRLNPAPFAGYYEGDCFSLMSASPERFVKAVGNEIETRPIKGTRRRKKVPEADLFTKDELRESEKDLSENIMIVDLLRNDLSKVCRPGSIRVPQLCEVESYKTVQHLVSVVQGTLRDGLDQWDLLKAAFPGGSITGAPKVRATEIIAELEPTVRGPYTGSLFYVSASGQMDSNLLIRTFVAARGWLQCGVGGGIVVDSDPHQEYQETLHKAAGMLAALRHDEQFFNK